MRSVLLSPQPCPASCFEASGCPVPDRLDVGRLEGLAAQRLVRDEPREGRTRDVGRRGGTDLRPAGHPCRSLKNRIVLASTRVLPFAIIKGTSPRQMP